MIKNKRFVFLSIAIFIAVYMTGCATTPSKPYDYRPYLAQMPQSILVLPPVNESLDVMAPYIYLSTATRPLAEYGYYVYPVAVVDALMKENGVVSPEDMRRISLSKIKEIIGPDAVLYLTINDWGTKYKIIDSQTVVFISGQLVDTDTGIVIWSGSKKMVSSSSQGHSSIESMLLAALINQFISNLLDPSVDVSRSASANLYYNQYYGLLPGSRHNNYQKSQADCRKRMEQLSVP